MGTCIESDLETPRRVLCVAGRVPVSVLCIHDMHEAVVALGRGEHDHERYERYESMDPFEEERRVWTDECGTFAR